MDRAQLLQKLQVLYEAACGWEQEEDRIKSFPSLADPKGGLVPRLLWLLAGLLLALPMVMAVGENIGHTGLVLGMLLFGVDTSQHVNLVVIVGWIFGLTFAAIAILVGIRIAIRIYKQRRPGGKQYERIIAENQRIIDEIEQARHRQKEHLSAYSRLGGADFYPQSYLSSGDIFSVLTYVRDHRANSIGAAINILVNEKAQKKRDADTAAYREANLAEQRKNNQYNQIAVVQSELARREMRKQGELTREAINDPEWRHPNWWS